MGAKIGSFLATLMLSVPLAAVGLMAIFGVPQFAPLSASPNAEAEAEDELADADAWDVFSDDPPPTSQQQDAPFDRFAENPNVAPRSQQRGQEFPASRSMASPRSMPERPSQFDSPPQSSGEFSEQQPPLHWSQTPNNSAGREMSAASNHSDRSNWDSEPAPAGWPSQNERLEGRTVPDSGAAPTQMTWREASLRLADLGIQKYHLEAGAQNGTFLFVCLYTPSDAPQVTHRFEAEASDPLVAVNQVLGQLDQWMRARFASSRNRSNAYTLPASDVR